MVIVFLRVCRRSHLWNDNALMDPMVVKQSSFIPKKPSALLLYSCADRHGHYSLISVIPAAAAAKRSEVWPE